MHAYILHTFKYCLFNCIESARDMCVCVFSVTSSACAFRWWGRNDWCEILDEALVQPKTERVAPHDMSGIPSLCFARILLTETLGSMGKWSGSRAGYGVAYPRFSDPFCKITIHDNSVEPRIKTWGTRSWHQESNSCWGWPQCQVALDRTIQVIRNGIHCGSWFRWLH